MSIRLPLAVRVTCRTLVPSDAFEASVLLAVRPTRVSPAFAVHAFAFKSDERSFARELLARRTELWLYRSNQRAFCGDFLAVDMSSPLPSRRRAFVIELKLAGALRVGSGGVQMKNAPLAVRHLGSVLGPLGVTPPFETVTGDAASVIEYLS
jgi:hypothetical protein